VAKLRFVYFLGGSVEGGVCGGGLIAFLDCGWRGGKVVLYRGWGVKGGG